MQILTPESFGAVADGITNDAKAIWQAIAAAKDGDTVRFASHKTYYLSGNGLEPAVIPPSGQISGIGPDGNPMAAICLDGQTNLTLVGEDTTLLIDAPLYYCNIDNTTGVTVQGLIFDYRIRPFAGAKTLSVDQKKRTALVQTDRSLHISSRYDNPEFGVLQKNTGRWHMFMDAITPVNEEENLYEILFSGGDAQTLERMEQLLTTPLIVPMPYIGHRIERAFSIVGNRDFVMRDCKVYSMARFGFAIFQNEGTMLFERLQVCKAPGETVDIVGWRDGFHVKENRAKITWDSCKVEYLYDDVFNISCSMLCVNQVIAPNEIDLFWPETGGCYAPLQPGDTLRVLHYATGQLLGQSAVAQVVEQKGSHNRILLTDALENLPAGKDILVCFDSMVAPGAQIKDCDFMGTFRFRGPITISNTRFQLLRMWLDFLSHVEGPVPKGVHFEHCTLACDDTTEPYIHLRSQKADCIGSNPYHVEDIVFHDCALSKANFDMDPLDSQFVTFS